MLRLTIEEVGWSVANHCCTNVRSLIDLVSHYSSHRNSHFPASPYLLTSPLMIPTAPLLYPPPNIA